MQATYRADHIGSLLRPASLLRARESGLEKERLRKIEDEFITEAIRRQHEIGLDIVTDEEFAAAQFHERLRGCRVGI